MTTALALLSPADAPPAPRQDAPPLDLMALIFVGLKPTSVAAYRKDYEAFRKWSGAPSAEAALWSLLQLDSPQANALVLAWQGSMLERQRSAATVARRTAALVRATRRARMVGLTTLTLETEAPKAEAFRDVRGPGKAGWTKLLDQAQTEAADGSIRTARNLAIVLLLRDRGARRGEVVGIDWPGDFDPDRPGVAIVGKGRSSREWLTVNDRTKTAILRYVALRGEWAGPLFIRTDRPARGGEAPARLQGESVNLMVKALGRRAGLPRACNAHSLRHEGISSALESGWDVRQVKAFSRHKKIDTVLIYDDARQDIAGEITNDLGVSRTSRKRRGRSG